MAKNGSQLVAAKSQEQLLSKQAIALPPKERLRLLLSSKYYPIVKKRTSAESQIKEMIDFYKICGLMMLKYFPNEEAETNYVKLAMIETAVERQVTNLPISEKLSEAFNLVKDYEEFESKITAIKNLFWQYSQDFPELCDKYNLEDIAGEKVLNMLDEARYMVETCPSEVERVLKRWELL